MAKKFSVVMDVQKALQNIKKLNEKTLQLRKNLKGQQKGLNEIFKAQAKIVAIAEQELKSSEKLAQKEKQRQKITERIAKARKSSADIIKGTPFAFIAKMNENMGQFLMRAKDIQKAGGFQKVFSGYLKETLGRLNKFGGVAKSAIGSGLNVMLMNAGGLFKLVLTQVGLLAASFAPVAAAILAIVGIFLLLRKAWQFNIGGMQNTWFQFVGKVRDAWGKFNIGLLKTLRKLDPVFRVIFGTIGAIVGGTFDGIMNIVKPVFAAINDVIDIIMKSFSEISGGGGDTKKILKAISSTLSIIGKVIGFVLSLSFKFLAIILKIQFAIYKKLGIFKLIKAVFSVISSLGEGLVKSFEKVYNFVTKILQKLGLMKKEEKDAKDIVTEAGKARKITGGAGASFQTATNTTNNNTFSPTVSVSTSAPITPVSGPMIADGIVTTLRTQRAMR